MAHRRAEADGCAYGAVFMISIYFISVEFCDKIYFGDNMLPFDHTRKSNKI